MRPALLLSLLLLAGPATAREPLPLATLREQEIAQCLPGEASTWNDGRDRPAIAPALAFAYDHGGAPSGFTRAQVLAAIGLAASAWSRCGISARALDSGGAADVRVLWSEAGSRGNAGLADLGRRSVSLNPAFFVLLRQRNPRHPAEQTLQMTLSHEMGHFFGLMAHSRRCVDVMSYYHDGKGQRCLIRGGGAMPAGVEYRALLPTACDIQRCLAANSVNRANGASSRHP